MSDTESISIRISADEIGRVDELRGEGVSRSAFVRQLLRRAGPLDDAPTYAEVVILLARSARAGKVEAQSPLNARSVARMALMRTTGSPGPWAIAMSELDRFPARRQGAVSPPSRRSLQPRPAFR